MCNIAVVGDRDSVYGFAALVISVFYIQDPQDARRIWQLIRSKKYAIVYITEQTAGYLSAEIESVQADLLPSVILIPGISGNTGQGMQNVREAVERAVGSDLLFNDQIKRNGE